MRTTVAVLGCVAIMLLASNASAATISVDVVGTVDDYYGEGTLKSNGDTAEKELIANILQVNVDEITYEKIDVGGSSWVEVTGEASGNLWAFDFSPYVSDPQYFLVKLGNALSTHYLYENVSNLQYGVIDLAAFDARSGNITILSVSHTATVGGSTPVPEPSSISLLVCGLVGAAVARRKRRHAI